GATGPSLVTISATSRPSGAFTGSVVLRDVPEGEYRLQLTTGADVVAEVGVRVDRILKPAYRLEITTGRRVYIAGDRIRVTARATFYEGSPVPGLPLLVDGFLDASAPTDATGTATLRTVARAAGDDESEGHSVESVAVRPARAEEGESAGASREFIVFPSSWTIRGDTELRDGRVHVNGAVNVVDRDRLESEIADGTSPWDLDPRGDPVAGAAVIAAFTEFVPVRRQTGTTYDFIEKKVVPTYDYTVTERDLGSIRLTTNARGAFATSVPAGNSDHSYRVKLSATDPDGHVARSASDVNGGADAERQGVRGATLEPTDDPTGERRAFGVGDEIDLTMRDPDVAASDEDRYLFYVAQRGIREAAVRSSARFTTTFDDRAPPGIRILGVRFTGSGYVVSDGFWAEFRVSDRAITVGLTPDKDRYRPGDEVTMQVTTRAGDGRPLAASVVLRVVDEKLFAIDAAESVDPLLDLYRSVDDGIRATYRSHQTPRARFEGGDTGGGDERADFRDSVLFRAIDTGSDGKVSVTFRLSDDITSWRVSGAALATDLRAGEASVRIPVGLPFFVDAAVAPEYLVSDRPSIQVRAFGSALEADSRVTFSVDADSLGLHVDDLRADAFAAVTVKLPTLTLGRHTITFTARSGSGDAARRDRLTRTITVVESRLTRTRTAYQDLTEATRLQGGGGMNEIIVSDASSGRYLPLLIDLAAGESARLERGLAADLAASLIAERSGRDGHEPGAAFDGSHYQTPDGGLAILPYSSSDLAVSALAAIVAPDRFDRQRLDVYLGRIADDDAETRERRMYALSGRAGLGSAVLPDIAAAAADPELTIRERLMLGLGAAALGDATTARTIAADLVERHGEGVDDQARLRVGDDVSDVTAATAMMAVLAAWNGDPLADRFWAYVEANPSTEAPHALHAVAYVARIAAQRVPSSASFRYRVGDEATVVELEPGGSFHLSLTADRLADLTIEPVSGSIGVTTSWTEPVKATAFEVDPDITIERTITPAATIGTADLVIVDLTVSFGPRAPAGCHRVTDLVPSGLVMVGALHAWRDPDEPTEGASDAGVSYPYEQMGQRARFCAEATPPGRSAHLRYFARVVTPGVYTWEPAIVESRTGLDRAATTNVGEIVIR
nr:hypothetical protein [Chloroflexota bacterium]